MPLSSDAEFGSGGYELACQFLARNRGRGQGSFVGDTRQHAIDFYGDIVQTLKPWRPGAPKLPSTSLPPDADLAQPEPPAFSTPYGRLPGEANEPTEGDGSA